MGFLHIPEKVYSKIKLNKIDIIKVLIYWTLIPTQIDINIIAVFALRSLRLEFYESNAHRSECDRNLRSVEFEMKR